MSTIRYDGGMSAVWERITPWPGLRRLLAWVLPLGALAFAVLVWPFPAPLGVVVNGALVGGRVALIALGIALVYRANRVINFAAGDLGQVPAVLAVLLVLDTGWNYWIAAGTGLVAAIVLGAVVETVIIRRFFRAPRLILTVATIGVSQLLIFGALVLSNQVFGELFQAPRLDVPLGWRFAIGQQFFNANDVITAIVIPVCFVALALFLTRSSIGVAVRASAERADRASLLGIPVHRLHTVVWTIASVLAFVSMFLRAGSVGLPLGELLGPFFLIQALAAVVIGRMERFGVIAIAAVGIGILDQALTFQPGYAVWWNSAMLFLVVLVALLVTRRPSTTRAGDVSTWQAVREVRPIPRELAGLPEVRYVRWAGGGLLLAFLLALPLWLPESRMNLVAVIVIFGIIGVSLVVLTGWAGQVSLGQVGFAGLGSAVGGALTAKQGWDLSLALLVGGIVGAGVAVVIGYPAIRRRGLTLAVITLAFALFMSDVILSPRFELLTDVLPRGRIERPDLFGVIDISSDTRYYYLSLAVLALMYAVARGVRRSRTGRALVAIRENENAARAYGIGATRTTVAAFAISGFMAAVAGVLFVHQQNGLGFLVYRPEASLQAFSMVVIGGLGSLPGALLGATYVRGADYFLPAEWQFLATGAGLLLVLLVLPGGLGAAVADVRDAYLRRVARRRDLLVPSLVADRRVEAEPLPTGALAAAEDAAAAAVVEEHVP